MQNPVRQVMACLLLRTGSMAAVEKKIMVFAQALELRIFLETVLAEGRYTTVIAEDSEAAFEKIITDDPSLIIIDMMMSDQQGINMYRQLKAHEKFKSIPVIMLSTLAKEAFFQFQHIEYTLPRTGLTKPEGYLLKPPEAEELLQMVQVIFKNHSKKRAGGKHRCH